MSTWLRRSSVRVRLVAGFLAAGLAVIAVTAVAVMGLRTNATGARDSRDAQAVAVAALDAKYLAADWNGWQTAYVFEDSLDPASLTAPDGSRASFLTSADALGAALDELAGMPGLTTGEAALVRTASTSYDRFMQLDEQVMTGLQSGTADGVAGAQGLVLGEEITVYQQVATAVGTLAEDAVSTSDRHASETVDGSASLIRLLLVVSAVIAAVLLVAVPAVVSSITGPVRRLEVTLNDIADGEGDLTARLDTTGRDELSRASTSFNRFVEQMAGVIGSVAASAASVAAAAEQMSQTSRQIGASASSTSQRSGAAASAAEEVSHHIQTVSAGASQMAASIQEISRSAGDATQVAGSAVSIAEEAGRTVGRLGASSEEIGSVVRTISKIAEQTNLLALNATIEAARAGEAGRGFAVVAHEVKELALQTAHATEDITQRIGNIQADSAGAVQAIDDVRTIVASINDSQVTIASAVEEQTATTGEMTRSVSDAAGGASRIADSVSGVSSAADLTAEGVAQTQIAVESLTAMAHELEGQVRRFRY